MNEKEVADAFKTFPGHTFALELYQRAYGKNRIKRNFTGDVAPKEKKRKPKRGVIDDNS